MSGQFDKASDYYAKAAKHTVDPVMDIYARLNDAKMLRNRGSSKELDNSIATLLKMAKKDKYETYRDIIYHSAGQLSLQRPDTLNGIAYFVVNGVIYRGRLDYGVIFGTNSRGSFNMQPKGDGNFIISYPSGKQQTFYPIK